jgi:hypothetical protein
MGGEAERHVANKKQRKRRHQRRRLERRRSTQAVMRSLLHPDAPSALLLRKLWVSPEALELRKEFHDRVVHAIPTLSDAEGRPIRGIIPAADAWDYLETIHEVLTERVMDLTADRGSAEWLWWLRRLDGQFRDVNRMASTAPYVQAVAETLSSGVVRPSTPLPDHPTFEFGLDDKVLLDLVWLREISIAVYQLHATMKRCAKGQPIDFGAQDIPRWQPNDLLDDAIEDYDERNEREAGNFLRAVGVVAPQEPSLAADTRIGGLVPHWYAVGVDKQPAFDRADPLPTLLGWIDLDGVPPLRDQRVLTDEHVAVIALLWACFNIMTRQPEHAQRRMSAALQWGYMVTPTEGFLHPALEETVRWIADDPGDAIAGCWQPRSAADVLGVLSEIKPEVWPPLCGGPVHQADGHSVVDLRGSSRRLFATLVRPVDGSHVNFWSEHFERDVQEVIDGTHWRPAGDARDLVGRKISKGDALLTDLDAVGASDGRLLLVSCKSTAFTVPALRGEHAITRNLVDKIHSAAREWDAIVDAVRAEPSMLPGKLDPTTRIDGCVVFPSVPFFTEGRWRNRRAFTHVPFLASVEELREALSEAPALRTD